MDDARSTLLPGPRSLHVLSHLALGLSAAVGAATPAAVTASSSELPLPPRTAQMESGTEFARRVSGLSLAEREVEIELAILKGNTPSRLRRLQPVRLPFPNGKTGPVITIFVTPDYLSVGSDEDWLWVPMSPVVAQRIADRLDCVLPTPRVVDAVHQAAKVKLPPHPLPPGPSMTTLPMFEKHSADVRAQLAQWKEELVAGHKKDVVICHDLSTAPGKVAIYGWHRTNGQPIQPLYLGHAQTWVDYSHGIRLVSNRVLINGQTNSLARVLEDPELAPSVTDEPLAALPRYSFLPNGISSNVPPTVEGESFSFVEVGANVRALAASPSVIPAAKPVYLVLYALPNGNTIEQTLGKRMRPGDDWHFDIQHIGAQTRFLREADPEHAWVVIYLEADGLAWPAWRKRYDDSSIRIVDLVGRCAQRFPDFPMKLVLAGHSGGGSFIFGYLNGVAEIPDTVERIAFLDANYAYDPSQGHAGKLLRWLQSSPARHLSVFAYDDSVALLEGKPFVSATGGTWGRSQLMLSNFGANLVFEDNEVDGLHRHRALGGRLQFLLKENPERKILHTVQVERNGFIHAMLGGTAREEEGYRYFGPRAYEKWIR
jgi:hypothetical protein